MSSKGPSHYPPRGFSDLVSYEDVAVSQYMNQLNTKATWNNESEVPRSSCSKLLGNRMMEKSSKFEKIKNRRSAGPLSSAKRVIAWKPSPYEDGSNDCARKESNIETPRPASAPVRSHSNRRSSLSSLSSSDFNGSSVLTISDVSSSSHRRRKQPLYKQKNKVLCVRAFVNGDRDHCARVTAPNLKQLLEECTNKLRLVSAARKIFLSDGTLVERFQQIKNNSDIYVSCGEAFRDPFGKYKEKEKLGRLSTWTMNGIIFPESKTRGKTKPSLSERMKVLVEKQKRRILVFANEDYSKGREVVAGRFDEFLDDCTQKLDFESGARALYDWDGKEISSFSEVPVVDNVLQPATNTVIGPLWVTRGGEKFSFKGPCGFVTTLLETTKERLKEAKDYENQLELRLQGSDEAISVEVMSFTVTEIENELQQVRNRIKDLELVIPKLKSRNKQLQLAKREEEMCSASVSSFKFQNIAEIEENSRLLGKKGVRLKVYENGKIDDEVIVYFNIHDASKGVSNDHQTLMERLLDAITAHQKVLKQGHGPAGRSVARKIYRDNGKEIVNVHELNNDDSIWLSFGEPFKSPYTYALHLVVDKTKLYSLWNEKKIIQRESLNDDICGNEKANLWRTVDGYPSDCNLQEINFDIEPAQKVAYAQGLQPSQIQEKNAFIQSKKNTDLILYPELSVEKKLSKADGSVWPPDCQKWVIDKNGLIYSRAFPRLCLCASDLKVKVDYADGTILEGFVVKLAKRNVSSTDQLWNFTPSGDICSSCHPSLVLTWISNENYQLVNDENLQNISYVLSPADSPESPENDNEESTKTVVDGLTTMKDIYGGEKYSVAVLPKLSGKHDAIGNQRWALKQESLNDIGQWKYSQVPNAEWNRRALSWPVKQNGTINEDFKWPMEGVLVCDAPPIKRRDTSSIGRPVRLRVRKNGDNDANRTVTVIGPDLSNMARDIRGKSFAQSNNLRKSSSSISSSRSEIRSLESNLFLDRCTEALQLPFAARRLFDESGAELFYLTDLQRNQLVFVSCGEAWVDFKTSHSEQQRRAIMTNLASDVARLKQYCSLRNPKDLVLTIPGSVSTRSPVCVTHCNLIQEDPDDLQEDVGADDPEVHASASENSLEGVRDNLLSAHERAHVKSEERLKTLRWPWETAITTNGEISVEDKQHGDFEHDVVYSNHRLNKRFRYHSVKNQSRKGGPPFPFEWFYKDGFFHLQSNHQLVLGVDPDSAEEKIVNEVVVCKKRLDDSNQRWIIANDGTIHLRSNSDLILTVSGPRLDSGIRSEDGCIGYEGCNVLVMPRKPVNGNANQLWSYDSSSGLLSAFAADTLNKEITAANKAGICTYAVVGSRKILQIGYSVEGDSTQAFLCGACAKASRGKLRLQRVEQNRSFSCSMGEADKPDKSGCFKCLSNKVDMSTQEADATLGMWEDQLNRLKKVTSIRTLNKEIQAAQSVPAVRIRAYKNGEGSASEPVLVVGSTVDSLLVQCTGRLGLTTAARRLYTADGLQITDINHLREASGSVHSNLNEKPSKNNRGRNLQVGSEEDPVDMVYIANECKITNDKENIGGLEKATSTVSCTTAGGRCGNRPATDVFVSCGEPFIPLQEVDKQFLLQRKHQSERTWVETHLETEKHVLRQMQGRRISARLSSEVLPGPASAHSWQELEKLEENKQENIDELTEHLKDLKSKQKKEKEKIVPPKSNTRILTNKRLYNAAKTVRIDVYENGDIEKNGVSVCGSSILQILNISTSRLGLSNAARRIFSKTGQEVHDISDLVKGESYSVSCGENFIQPIDRQNTVERKATWSRLNRMTGGAMAYKAYERSQSSMLALPGPSSQLTHY